ncbi:hypothetical protein J2125_000212 [Erwinia toletana]|uniref:Uncharacterized protein n=1 Tax=Winslowiella toletana TaxID=92490 RepID=A0ABS4P4L6_9GAMM|nr:hypothetical protein [Winslowiella toletana]MBP2167020.1 hypothetical protein [Winslowiella toletana]
MIIDKPLCNKILKSLLEDYPSHMSASSWEKATEGETELKKVAAQFKYLQERGYIDTSITEDEESSGKIIFYVNLPFTIITSYGIDFIEEGGFTASSN